MPGDCFARWCKGFYNGEFFALVDSLRAFNLSCFESFGSGTRSDPCISSIRNCDHHPRNPLKTPLPPCRNRIANTLRLCNDETLPRPGNTHKIMLREKGETMIQPLKIQPLKIQPLKPRPTMLRPLQLAVLA